MEPSPSSGIEKQYTPVEIAHLLQVKVKTVQMWLRDPEHALKGTKFGTMWRVSKSDLAAYLKGENSE